jgi:hypothetical protein
MDQKEIKTANGVKNILALMGPPPDATEEVKESYKAVVETPIRPSAAPDGRDPRLAAMVDGTRSALTALYEIQEGKAKMEPVPPAPVCEFKDKPYAGEAKLFSRLKKFRF